MSGSDYLRNTEPVEPGMATLVALMDEWHTTHFTWMESDGLGAGMVEGLFVRGFLDALPAALSGEDLVKLIVAAKHELGRRTTAGHAVFHP